MPNNDDDEDSADTAAADDDGDNNLKLIHTKITREKKKQTIGAN